MFLAIYFSRDGTKKTFETLETSRRVLPRQCRFMFAASEHLGWKRLENPVMHQAKMLIDARIITKGRIEALK